ncbi:MAG: hypothetical protein OXU20_25170 [Myxococcales bacterium]|nr:hypothetical protein [Myxococcales bacterium]
MMDRRTGLRARTEPRHGHMVVGASRPVMLAGVLAGVLCACSEDGPPMMMAADEPSAGEDPAGSDPAGGTGEDPTDSKGEDPAGSDPAGGTGEDPTDSKGEDPADSDPDMPEAPYAYSACARDTRVGGFAASLEQPGDPSLDPYSQVSGAVSNGIIPMNIPERVMAAGECELVRGRQLFCDPECGGDETCDEGGTCQPHPVGQDLGAATLTGLIDGTVSMSPRAPKYNYANTGSLSYPAFEEGAPIRLEVEGGAADGFVLSAEGVAPLAVNESEVALMDGQATVVTWTPPAEAGRSRVLATVNISLHGGDPFRIECDGEDDGELEIPAELVSELLKIDYSGFPAITLRRQTADSVELPWGCADLRVFSVLDRHPISIPGLTSCNENQATCPAGQACNLAVMRCE